MYRFSIMIVICVGLFLFNTPGASLAAAEWARVGGTHKYDRSKKLFSGFYSHYNDESGNSGTRVALVQPPNIT